MADFITAQQQKYPDHSEVYAEFGRLYAEKLWFELTEAVFGFVSEPANSRDDNFVVLYTDFVCQFADNINQLRLVQICGRAVQQQCPTGTVEEYAAGQQRYVDLCNVELLTIERNRRKEEERRKLEQQRAEAAKPMSVRKRELKRKKELAEKGEVEAKEEPEEEEDPVLTLERQKSTKLGAEAHFVLGMEIAIMMLRQGLHDRAQVLIAHGDDTLSSLDCADPFVHASLYRAKSELFKRTGPAEKFFVNALRMSAYTPPDTLSQEEQVAFAKELSLSAITGEGIYNFGEVVALPVFDSLSSREDCAWLLKLMLSFKSGDMKEFTAVRTTYATDIANEPMLHNNESVVLEKIALLCLMELVFRQKPESRNVSFAEIAEVTGVGLDKVEVLVIRAMSVGLIRGSIDEIDGVVNVTWLKPRVLDRQQIGAMGRRFAAWKTTVKEASDLVKTNAADVFA